MKKVYAPLTLDEAEKFLYTEGKTADVVDTMEEGEKLIYAELLKLHRRLDDIENQADEMMSPEKMSDMIGGMFGNGGGFGGK